MVWSSLGAIDGRGLAPLRNVVRAHSCMPRASRSPACHMAFPLASAQAALLPLAAGGAAARRAAAGAQPPLAASDACVCAPRLARPRSRRGASVAAAATTPAKDRGEWTRFLEFSGDSTRASVDCILLPGGRAAEVTVVAPDRPGLLSDIAAAIASLGLTIDKARSAWQCRRAMSGGCSLLRAAGAAAAVCPARAAAVGCTRAARTRRFGGFCARGTPRRLPCLGLS